LPSRSALYESEKIGIDHGDDDQIVPIADSALLSAGGW
jgi:hypothetical protein